MAIALVAVIATARAEDKPSDPVAAGKQIAEQKKCTICHSLDGKDAKKKPIKVEGKSDEWIAKFLSGEEKTPDGKPHLYKGKLTEDEKKALIEFVKSLK